MEINLSENNLYTIHETLSEYIDYLLDPEYHVFGTHPIGDWVKEVKIALKEVEREIKNYEL